MLLEGRGYMGRDMPVILSSWFGRVRMLEQEIVQITVYWTRGTWTETEMRGIDDSVVIEKRKSEYQPLQKGRRMRKKEKRKKENVTRRGRQKMFPKSKG